MTDAEFLKALDTPYNRKWVIADDGNGDFIRVGDIIDLVYRKNAEIERLQKKVDYLKGVNKRKDAHLQRLTDCMKANGELAKTVIKELKTAKSEARKEFAERLKERVKSAWAKHFCVFPPPQNSDISQKYLKLEDFDKHINNLLTEMEEE